MRSEELADTVLRQIECLWILQEITHELSRGNPNAERLLDTIYHRRNPDIDWRRLHFLEMKTALAMLILPICFISQLSEAELRMYDFTIQDGHDLMYRQNGQPADAHPADVLRTMRNALAHLPDFAAGQCEPNVSFQDGILRLWSEWKSSEVVFQSQAGFLCFVTDIITVARQHAVRLGNPQ